MSRVINFLFLLLSLLFSDFGVSQELKFTPMVYDLSPESLKGFVGKEVIAEGYLFFDNGVWLYQDLDSLNRMDAEQRVEVSDDKIADYRKLQGCFVDMVGTIYKTRGSDSDSIRFHLKSIRNISRSGLLYMMSSSVQGKGEPKCMLMALVDTMSNSKER